MPELVSLLRKYESQQNRQDFEQFYPQIIDFFNTYAQSEDKRLNAIL